MSRQMLMMIYTLHCRLLLAICSRSSLSLSYFLSICHFIPSERHTHQHNCPLWLCWLHLSIIEHSSDGTYLALPYLCFLLLRWVELSWAFCCCCPHHHRRRILSVCFIGKVLLLFFTVFSCYCLHLHLRVQLLFEKRRSRIILCWICLQWELQLPSFKGEEGKILTVPFFLLVFWCFTAFFQ